MQCGEGETTVRLQDGALPAGSVAHAAFSCLTADRMGQAESGARRNHLTGRQASTSTGRDTCSRRSRSRRGVPSAMLPHPDPSTTMRFFFSPSSRASLLGCDRSCSTVASHTTRTPARDAEAGAPARTSTVCLDNCEAAKPLAGTLTACGAARPHAGRAAVLRGALCSLTTDSEALSMTPAGSKATGLIA